MQASSKHAVDELTRKCDERGKQAHESELQVRGLRDQLAEREQRAAVSAIELHTLRDEVASMRERLEHAELATRSKCAALSDQVTKARATASDEHSLRVRHALSSERCESELDRLRRQANELVERLALVEDECRRRLEAAHAEKDAAVHSLRAELTRKQHLVEAMQAADPAAAAVATTSSALSDENAKLKQIVKQMRLEMEEMAAMRVPEKLPKVAKKEEEEEATTKRAESQLVNDVASQLALAKKSNRELQAQLDKMALQDDRAAAAVGVSKPSVTTDSAMINSHIKTLNDTISKSII